MAKMTKADVFVLNRHYWRSHSFQYKRTALPLTDEEKRLHVFQKPENIHSVQVHIE